ncbi:MAG: Asp/Glu racemase [Pseudomonadota bacterium]
MSLSSRGRARIGVLVPFTNTNLEPDMALLCPDGVSLHVARLGGYDEDEIPDETQMRALGAADLDTPLALLSGAKPDVILYGCTSATLTNGPVFDQDLSARINSCSGAATVTAAGALICALRALNVQTVGFASPYVPAINDEAVGFLRDMQIETVNRSEFGEALNNAEQGALTPVDVMALGRAADHPKAGAIVLSCTDMRSVEVIEELEQELGKPVITSNQAMMFNALSTLGISDPICGFGRLLRETRG